MSATESTTVIREIVGKKVHNMAFDQVLRNLGKHQIELDSDERYKFLPNSNPIIYQHFELYLQPLSGWDFNIGDHVAIWFTVERKLCLVPTSLGFRHWQSSQAEKLGLPNCEFGDLLQVWYWQSMLDNPFTFDFWKKEIKQKLADYIQEKRLEEDRSEISIC